MYSKEEAKQVRQDFWTFFGKRYDRKWLLYNTGIKDLVLKFEFEDNRAIVGIDLMHDDQFYREYYFDKLLSLKALMFEEVSQELIFDPDYRTESGKIISRIYVYLDNVKIQRKTDWPAVYNFYYKYMDRLEQFYLEYRDFVKN
ncbi:DUF4268 domain-containing protein [Nonlabens ponticola]|uniref:DUF4268 domain-containing protein n=1 Tax=Nonlabens ponticola TaxID=2496866 RepID=A0A3S9MXW8_9FLAO|nr:DUF4268 domain-containing protein [Nonlabens ponticola]AZQ44116.1 DUF4268 domain-containing protein [Nonlabens ponticola]